MDAKEYRAAIRPLWLPHVGRKVLKKYEVTLIEQWRAEGIPVELVAKAIKRTVRRVPVVTSIGICRYDLVALQKEDAKLKVGIGDQVKCPHQCFTEDGVRVVLDEYGGVIPCEIHGSKQ